MYSTRTHYAYAVPIKVGHCCCSYRNRNSLYFQKERERVRDWDYEDDGT